jgi:rhodanese-related sulfurtransferase
MSRKHPRSPARSLKPVSNRKHKTRPRNLVWLWVALGVLLVIGVGILLGIPKTASSVELTVAQANLRLQQGAFFLDVRTQQEWDQFRTSGSTLIPLDELPYRLNELPNDKDIIVVCQSGQRAQTGVTILKQAGFSRVSYIVGGLQAWVKAGYPVQSGLP